MGGMKILGIDPGLGIVGFGLLTIDGHDESAWQSRWGTITTEKDKTDAERLVELYHDMKALLTETAPDAVSIEKIFYFKNAKTLVPVSQARGVILLAIQEARIPMYDYTPMQVKQAITGYGKSTKREIQEMVQRLLHLEELPRPDDAADGLALAYCHYQFKGRLNERIDQHESGLGKKASFSDS